MYDYDWFCNNCSLIIEIVWNSCFIFPPANWDLSMLFIPPPTAASKRGEHNDRSCESSNRDISICGWQWVSGKHFFWLLTSLVQTNHIYIYIRTYNNWLPYIAQYDIIKKRCVSKFHVSRFVWLSVTLCDCCVWTNPAKSATVTIQTISLQGITLNTHICSSRFHLQSITYKTIQFTHLPAPMWPSHGGSSKLPCLGLHILLVIPRVEGITLQQRCCLCHGRRTWRERWGLEAFQN